MCAIAETRKGKSWETAAIRRRAVRTSQLFEGTSQHYRIEGAMVWMGRRITYGTSTRPLCDRIVYYLIIVEDYGEMYEIIIQMGT